MSVNDWSPRPGGNAVADPAIPATDALSGRQVGGSIRGVMAGVSALALDQGGALVSTGTDNVYVLATHSAISDLKPGVSVTFWADRDNTADAFLAVDGSGPRRWYGADGLNQPGGAIQSGLLYTVAWADAAVGKAPGWYTTNAAGGSGTIAGVAFDFSGTFADRATYDAQPKGKVFLAVADTPLGPAWTLYLKRSNAFGDWSPGLPIKASPAQSTVEAQAAADRAQEQVGLAAAAGAEQVGLAAAQAEAARVQAQLSASQAAGSISARTASEIARDAAAERAALAQQKAADAAAAAADARSISQIIGAQVYDFSFDSAPSSSDDWSN